LTTLGRALAVMAGVRLLLNPEILAYPIGERPLFHWLLYGVGVPPAALRAAPRRPPPAGGRTLGHRPRRGCPRLRLRPREPGDLSGLPPRPSRRRADLPRPVGRPHGRLAASRLGRPGGGRPDEAAASELSGGRSHPRPCRPSGHGAGAGPGGQPAVGAPAGGRDADRERAPGALRAPRRAPPGGGPASRAEGRLQPPRPAADEGLVGGSAGAPL